MKDRVPTFENVFGAFQNEEVGFVVLVEKFEVESD